MTAAILVFGALVGLRVFLDYRADLPIVDPYLTTIAEISSESPRARRRLEQYYAKYHRETVASKHYPGMCDELQKLAAEDGIKRSLHCPPLFDTYEKP